MVTATAGTMTSLKLSIAVCRIAGAQMVPRPMSNRWANGSEVTAATNNVADPTTGPDVMKMGRWATATSGIVQSTAAPNDRPARSRRYA